MKSKFFLSSILAAASGAKADGFRQREVRFYMDLFSNWVFVKMNSEPFPLHNTQIMRSLDNMVRLGLVKKMGRQNPPRYKLTRVGLVRIANELVSLPLDDSYADFLFVFQFIVNYKRKIFEYSKSDASQFSNASFAEVERLLNEKKFLMRQMDLVDYEKNQLRRQIKDSENCIKLFFEMKKKGLRLPEIVKVIEQKYPFELSSKKRLSKLFKEIPESSHEMELTIANQSRIHLFWKPRLIHLESFSQILRSLPQKN